MELICPAGTPSAFRGAVDAGADAVYCGFRNETNARNFPGLNFSPEELASSIAYGKAHGVHTYVALNTFMRAGAEQIWYDAADTAVQLGADALIVADIALMAYVAERYPQQRLHASVQASASNAGPVCRPGTAAPGPAQPAGRASDARLHRRAGRTAGRTGSVSWREDDRSVFPELAHIFEDIQRLAGAGAAAMHLVSRQ